MTALKDLIENVPTIAKKLGTIYIEGDLLTDLDVDANIHVKGHIGANIKVSSTGKITYGSVSDDAILETDTPHKSPTFYDIVVRGLQLTFTSTLTKNGDYLFTMGEVINAVDTITQINTNLTIYTKTTNAFINNGTAFYVTCGSTFTAFSAVTPDDNYTKGWGIENLHGSFIIGDQATVKASGELAGLKNYNNGIFAVYGKAFIFGGEQAINNTSNFYVRYGRVHATSPSIGFYNYGDNAYLVVQGKDGLLASAADDGVRNLGGKVEVHKESSMTVIGGISSSPIVVDPKADPTEEYKDIYIDVDGDIYAYSSWGQSAVYNEYGNIYGKGMIYSNGNTYYQGTRTRLFDGSVPKEFDVDELMRQITEYSKEYEEKDFTTVTVGKPFYIDSKTDITFNKDGSYTVGKHNGTVVIDGKDQKISPDEEVFIPHIHESIEKDDEDDDPYVNTHDAVLRRPKDYKIELIQEDIDNGYSIDEDGHLLHDGVYRYKRGEEKKDRSRPAPLIRRKDEEPKDHSRPASNEYIGE